MAMVMVMVMVTTSSTSSTIEPKWPAKNAKQPAIGTRLSAAAVIAEKQLDQLQRQMEMDMEMETTLTLL